MYWFRIKNSPSAGSSIVVSTIWNCVATGSPSGRSMRCTSREATAIVQYLTVWARHGSLFPIVREAFNAYLFSSLMLPK